MNIKKRYWAFVLYPESAPADWRDILQLKGLVCAISPLHDKDLNATGESKKAHYHIILAFGATTTYNNVKNITELLNCPIPIPLESCRGYYRYFTHKDNPEKYQYKESEITTINGFDVTSMLSTSEISNLMIEIQKLIQEMHINEYCVLMDYLLHTDKKELWEVAANHTLFFDRYLQSLRYFKIEKSTLNNDTLM